jgi:phosphatidylglycerol---prolipoprotein diacylglyceryl transferase
MLIYPHINPIALSIGSLKVHWYGIMYMLGFIFFLFLGKWRIRYYKHPVFTTVMVDDFLFYGALGVILGGRIGYCLFYKPLFYLANPADIFKVWDGGMSFHGGMLGVLFALWLLSRKLKCSFFEVSDFVAPLVPIGLFFGRCGNFINGELWGRISESGLPWMMFFPNSGTMLPRHPSQIYEALGEGVLLFLILWIFANKPRKVGQVSGVFMIGYGIIRFGLEYFREPDSFLIEFAQSTGLSMGQWLSLPMIIIGLVIYYYATIRDLSQKTL